jgi:O-antigen ligase
VASRTREAIGPAYLFLCLLAGGSAQGVWANMVLQLLGLVLIAWAAAANRSAVPLPARQLFLVILAGLAWVALQLVPLPPSVWAHLGGREPVAAGYRVLGLAAPSLPLSLSPYDSLRTLLALIPALAILSAMIGLKAYRPSWLAAAMIAATFCGILLGAMQVASTSPDASPFYLFPESSFGLATGFFANANHMATLLVVSLPFLAALLASARRLSPQRYSALAAILAGAGLVVIVGIALNGSLAGYLLALPVIAASLLIVIPPRSTFRRWAAAIAALCLVVALGALEASSIRPAGFGAEASTSVNSRQEILETTTAAASDFMPFGSGVGTFRQVYRMYEDPAHVTATYVIHAHNDYAELALEAGIPGILLLLLFLAWWAAAVRRVWSSAEAGPYARAGSIASAAILAHSLVDFPLRTAAISVIFASCLALLADRRPTPPAVKSDLRPTRHVVLR